MLATIADHGDQLGPAVPEGMALIIEDFDVISTETESEWVFSMTYVRGAFESVIAAWSHNDPALVTTPSHWDGLIVVYGGDRLHVYSNGGGFNVHIDGWLIPALQAPFG
jgi:hypothetical protein